MANMIGMAILIIIQSVSSYAFLTRYFNIYLYIYILVSLNIKKVSKVSNGNNIFSNCERKSAFNKYFSSIATDIQDKYTYQ